MGTSGSYTSLVGRTALVTGGGDGIGAAVVRRLAADGANVLVAEIDDTAGRAIADTLRSGGHDVVHVVTDVAKRDQVEGAVAAAIDRWGRLDIVVNNAWGGGSFGRVENKTDEQMAAGHAVGFLGPFHAMRAAFPHMKAVGYGRIVNMCSLNGVNAHMGTLEYNTAKEALRALTRTAAREWADTGVVVNAVCPGAKTAAARRMEQMMPDLMKAAEASNPMGRLGDPDADIAPVVAFLVSEDARYLTGNTLFVDGGSHINGVAWSMPLPD